MPTIFYGVAGDGLGHASRALAILERMPDCEFVLFSSGQAFRYLTSQLQGSRAYRGDRDPVKIVMLPSIHLPYENGRLNLSAYLTMLYHYRRRQLSWVVRQILEHDDHYSPDLYLTDFEPGVAYAAKAAGANLICCDNQHYFCYAGTNGLPLKLRLFAHLCRWGVPWITPKPSEVIVPTFHWDVGVQGRASGRLVNGFLGRHVYGQIPQNLGHVLCYTRPRLQHQMLEVLAHIPRKIHVFGADPPMPGDIPRPNLTFHEPGRHFARLLATCDCVISTAGNQLLTEARYFGKPVLAVPEPGQYEQELNAHYAQRLGFARPCSVEHFTTQSVMCWLSHIRNCPPLPYGVVPDGADQAVAIIRKHLPNWRG